MHAIVEELHMFKQWCVAIDQQHTGAGGNGLDRGNHRALYECGDEGASEGIRLIAVVRGLR